MPESIVSEINLNIKQIRCLSFDPEFSYNHICYRRLVFEGHLSYNWRTLFKIQCFGTIKYVCLSCLLNTMFEQK
jgi:hypothetical protein